jgi:hypothetical protein
MCWLDLLTMSISPEGTVIKLSIQGGCRRWDTVGTPDIRESFFENEVVAKVQWRRSRLIETTQGSTSSISVHKLAIS